MSIKTIRCKQLIFRRVDSLFQITDFEGIKQEEVLENGEPVFRDKLIPVKGITLEAGSNGEFDVPATEKNILKLQEVMNIKEKPSARNEKIMVLERPYEVISQADREFVMNYKPHVPADDKAEALKEKAAREKAEAENAELKKKLEEITNASAPAPTPEKKTSKFAKKDG